MAETETAAPVAAELLLEEARDAAEIQRDRADAAEARVTEYENAVTWNTTCTSCATVLDSCATETERRARAEDALAAERERADNAVAELAALADSLGASVRAARDAERKRIRELADRNGAVCTGDEGTSFYFSALLADKPGLLAAAAGAAERSRAEAAEAKVAEAREGIGNFLAEYGDSEIPMFKVAQDLANSIRKILGDEEAPDA